MPAPLPVIRTIRDAFHFVWQKKVRLIRALAVPTLVITLLEFVLPWGSANSNEPSFYRTVLLGWLSFFIYIVPYVLFVITCHRLALIGNNGVPEYGNLSWSRRECQFLGWILVISIVSALCSMVINLLVLSHTISEVESGANTKPSQWPGVLDTLAYLPVLYVFSRLSVVYPATALDRQVDMKWAWRLTAHNGWRLTFVIGLLPWLLYFFINLFYREDATLVEWALLKLAGFIVLAVEIVALSFSYKYLSRNETDPVPSNT